MSAITIPLADGLKNQAEKSMPAQAQHMDIAERRRMVNKLEFLKSNLLQTHKKTQNACKACYSELSKIELLAFDCLMSDYLLTDQCPPTDLRAFINIFQRPPFNLLSGDRRDTETAEAHTLYLFEKIQNSIASLQRFRDQRIEQPKRAADIMQTIRALKVKLETELNSFPTVTEQNRPPSRIGQEQIQQETQQKQMVSITSDFTKWMNKNLTLNPESSENASLRSLFCSVASRYQSVCDLRAVVESLRAAKIPPQNIDYQICGLENISRSPFLKSARMNYKFLQSMLNNIRKQRSHLIPQCHHMIHRCQESINNARLRHEKVLADGQMQSAKLRQNLETRKEEVAKIKKELLPFAHSLSENKDLAEKYATIATDIDEEIEKKISDPQFAQQKKLLEELRDLRKETQGMCQKSISIMQSAACTETTIYKVVSDLSKADEQVRQNTREVEQLTCYEKYLTELSDLLKENDIRQWNSKIDKIAQNFETLQADSAKLAESVKPLISENTPEEDAAFEAEIDALEEKAQQLIQENIQLDNEIADATLENDTASEELFTVIQDLVAMQQVSPNCHSEIEEKHMMKLQKLILCPSCKANRRNCLLTTCMHPICKDCMKRANGVCPVCQVAFGKSDVSPFYFQN